jgi:phosphohistidine phosphatase
MGPNDRIDPMIPAEGRRVKVLYLLRHAKSSWDDPGLSDHERPLAPRGRRAAARIAEHLKREGIRPALVLCSSSRRTRQTLEPVAAAVPDVPVKVEADLYGAGEGTLLRCVKRLPDAADSVLVLGHNPGLHDLALTLAEGGDGEALARLRAKMPTAALATLAAPVTRWRDLRPGGAELVAFVVPRELG